jgi:predicted RNA binding protein YcfA (HicA-like mRNA interferase family)
MLEVLGFSELRQRGSHKQFRHPDGRCTTVPFLAGRNVSPFLLRQIAKDIGLRVNGFLRSKPNKMLKLRLIATNFKSANQI